MSDEAKKLAVRRWCLEVWGRGEFALADELVMSDYVYSAPGQGEFHGPEAVKQLIAMYRAAFPDMTNIIEEQIAEADVVVTRGQTTGTHQAPLGDMPATGRSMTVPWIMVSHFAGDRIANDYEIFDGLGMMQQLGAIPAPGQTPT